MNPSILRAAKFFIGWPVSILAIFFIVRITSTHISDITSVLGRTNPILLLLSLLAFVIYFFVRAAIWKYILDAHGHNLPFRDVSFLWSSSEIKRYLPGNIWSYLAKGLAFHERQVPKDALIASFFTEAQVVLLGCLLVTLFSLPFITYMFYPPLEYLLWTFPLGYFLGIFLAIVYIFAKFFSSYLRLDERKYIRFIIPQHSPKTNTVLLLWSLLSCFFYGLGTYLLVFAFVFLNIQYVWGFIGFFVATFFLGYVSILTPMGLGVREGALILGLSRIMSSSIATSISIFARLIFILSEVIALVVTFLWFKQTPFFEKVAEFIGKHKQMILLSLFVIIYIAYFTLASFLRYENFYTGRFDLGNMDQTVWNTMRGRIFQFTDPDGVDIISRLSFHADFLLVLLAPFYYIWSDPNMLLLLQSVVSGLGAVFVYAISQKVLQNKNLSLVFGGIFLLNPGLQYANLYDFHAVTFATTFLLATFYFMIDKKYSLFILFAILSGLCKEQIWLIIALFGFYIFLWQKKRIFGSLVILASFSIFYYLLWYAIPHTRGKTHFALAYYSDFSASQAGSPTDVIKSILFSPGKVITIIFTNGRIEFLKQLFIPVGFLSFLAPLLLIFIGPDMVINLLSNNSQLHQLYYQYTATITPFVFIAGVYGAKQLQKSWFVPSFLLSIYLIIMTVYSAYTFGPLPGAKNPNITMFTKPQPEKDAINRFLARIPKRYSVASTNNIGSHLSHRQRIYTVPFGVDQADVIAFLVDPYTMPLMSEQKIQRQLIEKIRNDKRYKVVIEKGYFIVFQKQNL